MSTIAVNTFGIVTVAYPGQPNESHILQAPNGGKWTVLGNGTTGSMTLTDGASGTAETWVVYDANGIGWEFRVSDAGILTVTSYELSLVLCPVVNAPITLNGLPAQGYQVMAYQAGTTLGATLYTVGAIISGLPVPVTLNEHGLPSSPIFVQVGTAYDLVLLPPGGGLPVKSWDHVVGGIPSNVATATEWGPAVSASYVSPTSATTPGDQRTSFPPSRRVKSTGDTTRYGTVSASDYDGTDTTITVVSVPSSASMDP